MPGIAHQSQEQDVDRAMRPLEKLHEPRRGEGQGAGDVIGGVVANGLLENIGDVHH